MQIFALPAVVLFLAIFMVPLGLVVTTSLSSTAGMFAPYLRTLEQPLYGRVFLTTMEISVLATLMTLAIGYPIAYHLSKQSRRRRLFMMILVLLPFWTSILVKSFAFALLLGRNGIINTALVSVFGEAGTLELLYNRIGVMIGMTHYLLPFMILILMSALLAQNPDLRRAATIMGAGPLRIFFRVTLPPTIPAVLGGSLICVIMSFGMFITPALLGGRQDYMISNLIELNIRETLDWPLASSLSIILIVLTGIIVLALSRVRRGGLLD